MESFNYVIREGLNKVVQNILPMEFALADGQRIELVIKVSSDAYHGLSAENDLVVIQK